MLNQISLSSYLVKPDLSSKRNRNWAGFRTQAIEISRSNPRIISKTFMTLLIWVWFIGSVKYLTTPHTPAAQAVAGGQVVASQPSALSSTAPASLARAISAPVLPSGPSGQLLPPGTMAPQGTYANNYAKGQCTWYVAGRRQVPAGWGNAVSWYYHAVSSGWSTGTTPAVAAIAWTPAGSFGHVALVEQISPDGKQVFISEMNYRGKYVRSTRWVNATAFKYIY